MTIAKKAATACAALAFAAALSLPIAISAEAGHTVGETAIRASELPQPRERHPEIRQAIRLLTEAQDHLSHGAHDFGGHRVKAMKHVSEALEDLHAALAYDRH